jgi:hypothetical protein
MKYDSNKITPAKLAKCLNIISFPYRSHDFRFLKTATINDFRIFIVALHRFEFSRQSIHR